MPPKKKGKKPSKNAKKNQSMGQLERSRILGQGNELLRLGQTSSFATNKRAPHRFLQYLRANGGLDQVEISVRDVGSRVVLTPGVYARGPGLTPSFEGATPESGAGPAVNADTASSEAQWRLGLCAAHAAVMNALDASGVSRMLDVRPTYVCPVQTCHFHCYSRLELLSHFRNEHVTKKSLLQSVTATTAAVEGSISKLSTDSLKTLLGVTELPAPEPLSVLLEQEEGTATDEFESQRPSIEGSLQLAENDDGTIVIKLPPPPDGVVGGSANDVPFVQFLAWLFSDWNIGDDGEHAPSQNPKADNEDEFERWIGCNHRLIYHYDHYVTARENIFLPCTIRGVRLMKDGQKVSMVVPEVMRPMKPKHVKSTASWKLHREHPEVTLESHNDDVTGEDCFTFKCAKFKSYQGTGKMARSPPVVIGGVPWRLMVYPDGNSAQDQGEYTSVFLEVDKSHDSALNSCWQCFVHFKLDILSSKLRHTYEKKAAHRFTSASMNWGFGQLMALPDVLDPTKGYLAPDGSVTFRATVRVVAGTDIEQWGGHTTYDSIAKTGMPGLPYWDGVDSPSCLRSVLQVLFYIPRVRKAVFGMQISPDDPMARPLVGLQLVFYWLHMVNDPNCSKERKEALKQAGSQLKEIMQGCSGWDALKQFPGWEPVTQSDLRLLIQVLLSSIDEQLKGTPDEGLMSRLFRGTKRSFVKCFEVEEESWEVEGYCNIELNVKENPEGTKDLMTAFRELCEPSVPIKYMTKQHGYQTADVRVLFQRLPPILIIQLVRFEEHAGQDGEKIKDRCEFPEHINLDEFLEEPGETPADYTLHAMLVHYDSKDQTSRSLYHGQHAAFIRPGPVQGDWYKFMDPFVKKAAATEDVLEEAFGESGEFCGQTYMLVYMRDEYAGELLRTVDEIPEANLDRLPQLLEKSPWSNDHNAGNDPLDDDWMEVEIVRQSDIATYNSVDICTFKETPVGTLFKVQKTNTVKALSQAVKDRFGLEAQPRLFQFIHRQNGSYRPDEYLETIGALGDKQIIECASSCSKFSQNKERWHLFMLDQSVSMSVERPVDKFFLLFFKLYDPVGGKTASGEPCPSLRHIGHTLAAYNETMAKLLPCVQELVGDASLDGAELDCFEEVSNTLVEDVNVSKTCRQQELQNGDILVVWQRGGHDVRDMDVFYAMLRNQVGIEFRELSSPHDHGFILSLEKTLSYNEVTAAVADHLMLDNPMKLQFTSFAVPHDGLGAPGRTIPPPSANQTLDDMRQFASRTFPCLSHKKSSQTLLYEVLDVPVTERLLQLTRERDDWLNQTPIPGKPSDDGPDIFTLDERESIRDLLKDMRQLAEAIRKDVRERIADLDRESTNLRTRNQSLQQDLDFVKKQLAALDEQELTSTNKRNKDVRKRLQAAREQRDHVEQAKGTRSQFEKDIAGLFHNYMCQVSQMVAKEPLKIFLGELEADFTVVIGKIWDLLWRGGLSREKFNSLVTDTAFAKYFEWQSDQMLHHAKMVKRKVAERVRIFLKVCYRARVDPLSQGIKAVFRYHLCGKAVQDLEDRQRNEQLKVDAEVDLVQKELLQMEAQEKAKKQAAVTREKAKAEERALKEKRRKEEEQKRALEEATLERQREIERKRAEEEESAKREEDLRRRRIAEQEKQRQEEEKRLAAEAQAKKEEESRKKTEEKKKREAEKLRKKQEQEQHRKQQEEERKRKEEAVKATKAKAAKEAKEVKEKEEAAAVAAAAKREKKEKKARDKEERKRKETEAEATKQVAAAAAAADAAADAAAAAAAAAPATPASPPTKPQTTSPTGSVRHAEPTPPGSGSRMEGTRPMQVPVAVMSNDPGLEWADPSMLQPADPGANEFFPQRQPTPPRGQSTRHGMPPPVMPHPSAGLLQGMAMPSPMRVGTVVRTQPLSPQHAGMMEDGPGQSATGPDGEMMWYQDQMHPQMLREQELHLQRENHEQALWVMQQQQQQQHAHQGFPPNMRGPQGSGVPAQDDDELAMWQAIEASQQIGMQQGFSPGQDPMQGRHMAPPQMMPQGMVAAQSSVPGPQQLQQQQQQQQQVAPPPPQASMGMGLQNMPPQMGLQRQQRSPQQPNYGDQPFGFQQPEPDFGASLPNGLLDDDEGGDIWSAMRAEEQKFQNQLDTNNVPQSSAFSNPGSNIW